VITVREKLTEDHHERISDHQLGSSFFSFCGPLCLILQEAKMEAVNQLPPHQQQEFMKNLEKMQLKDSLMYVSDG
jgi:hypothetical protein